MNSLDSPYNIYADLAQSSYHNRKNSVGVRYNFVNGMTKKQKRVLEKDRAIPFHFPNAKDAHGNDASTVYLRQHCKNNSNRKNKSHRNSSSYILRR